MTQPDQSDIPVEPVAPPSSVTRKVALRNLFLDPNNYRFIDQTDYVPVPIDAVLDSDVQRRTAAFLLGKNSEDVKDLIASFKKNGWLAVDQIQVRELVRGKYLVVEGNRRIATLKHLERRFENSAIMPNTFAPPSDDRQSPTAGGRKLTRRPVGTKRRLVGSDAGNSSS